MQNAEQNSTGSDLMNARREILEDGRYLIFYTFDESRLSPTAEKNGETKEKEENV